MAMIEQGMALLGQVRTVLDAPCGVGRATIWLARHGFKATGVDLGEGAVTVAKQEVAAARVEATIEMQDIFRMTYPAGAFDAVLCFRLLHHFPEPQVRFRLIQELCRVASRYVLISYISPLSVTSMRRRIRKVLTGKPVKQNPVTLDELTHAFQNADYIFHGRIPRSRFLHSLQLAAYRRSTI